VGIEVVVGDGDGGALVVGESCAEELGVAD
jgi:hypothetical protein